MRAQALLILICLLVVSGCADQKHWDSYYSALSAQTTAIVSSIQSQGQANRDTRTQQMNYFGAATVNAAKTTSSTDDVMVAFAWGYNMAQAQVIEVPKLPTLAAPDKHSDIVRAWTPLAGIAAPFLYPLSYGLGGANTSGDTAQVYNVEGGGDLVLNSQNTGSQNSKSVVTSGAYTNSFKKEETCTENCGDDGVSVNPTVGETGYECQPNEMVSPTCSCLSRQAGIC